MVLEPLVPVVPVVLLVLLAPVVLVPVVLVPVVPLTGLLPPQMSPELLQDVLRSLQQFQSVFRNMEEQNSEDQEDVYGVLCDEDR